MNEKPKEGMLFLCATPIGNLSDISERVLETLRSADIIAAEDTRNSIKLLNHFEIKVPMTSYHEHNRYDKARELIEKMKGGANVALITDAGTPAISDPGQVLTDMCHEARIKVTSLPGPCALVTALAMSGLDSRRFVFEGFLPSDKKSRRQVISDLTNEKRTIIIY
ncbi:MAG: 16S rRNA (cytidine(1402)-2'-O)-methyltransferase, partial [Lachnospiraceae bacterium]|nr:16S rRNA (cytidine(1402)-2'-O)-methyltransferase [Lachnospiraceae bacterium]